MNAEHLRIGGLTMELKPCPFCGGEAHLDREEIFCDCGAKMPIPLYVWVVGSCEGFPDFATAKAEMIEAWNRRADAAPMVHGRWVTKQRHERYPSGQPYEADYCSACGQRGSMELDYCPHCGADMREVDHEAD